MLVIIATLVTRIVFVVDSVLAAEVELTLAR